MEIEIILDKIANDIFIICEFIRYEYTNIRMNRIKFVIFYSK